MDTLETERLRLRQFRIEDLTAYSEICADEEVMRYIGNGKPLSREAVWRTLAIFLGHWQLKGYGMWAVEEKARGCLVGRIGLYYPEGWPELEVGWLLARSCWGKGYATEGGRAAIGYAFEVLRAPRVISLMYPENIRSIRVAERLGESLVGEIVVHEKKALVYELENPNFQQFSDASA